MTIDPIARLLGPWSAELTAASILLRIAAAFLFAAALGCERSNKRHSAGLRTFILVSLASAGAMLTDQFLIARTGTSHSLIAAATVLAVAVISTSSVLYSSKSQIKGLTTAAALFSCCVTGLLLGVGYYTAAAVLFLAVLCCISLLPPLEVYLKDRSNHFEIHLELKERRSLPDFIATLRKLGLVIDDIESNPAYANSGLSVFSVSLTITAAELKKYKTHSEIIEPLGTLDEVSHIEEIR